MMVENAVQFLYSVVLYVNYCFPYTNSSERFTRETTLYKHKIFTRIVSYENWFVSFYDLLNL